MTKISGGKIKITFTEKDGKEHELAQHTTFDSDVVEIIPVLDKDILVVVTNERVQNERKD